jgi:ribosomal protein L40E
MVSKHKSVEYICRKNPIHREVSMAGQKKICWQCGALMDIKRHSDVVVKRA